jgi:RNase P/RNase MRP subunit p29
MTDESLPASSEASPSEVKPVLVSPITQDNEGVNPIEEAKKVLEETKKTLELITAERKKIEKATAEMLLNGTSRAGQINKTETPDEKWAREAKIRYAGTGLDPTG